MRVTLASDLDPSVSRLVERFWQRLYQPASTIDASWIRIVIFGLFAYKLLSRDFSALGDAPISMLGLYPAELFQPRHDFLMLGFQPLVDAVTFHWVHWFLPLPNALVLGFIQYAIIGLCLATMIFGRGHRNILAILTFIGLTYLFGFLWRVGHDVDAVFVPLQIALIYCFSKHQEWTPLNKPESAFSSDAGWFTSMVLLCFIGYYFLSGLNKITDLTILDWFNYHISDIIQDQADKIIAGSHAYAPTFFLMIADLSWLGLIVVPAVYLSHLAIPVIFFRRDYVASFFVFYLAFHFVSLGVGIFFFALMLTWLALLPMHRLLADIQVGVQTTRPQILSIVQMLGRLGPKTRVTIQHHEQNLQPSLFLTVSEPGFEDRFDNFRAIRRICWAIPLCWPLLPLLYIPCLDMLVNFLINRRWAH